MRSLAYVLVCLALAGLLTAVSALALACLVGSIGLPLMVLLFMAYLLLAVDVFRLERGL